MPLISEDKPSNTTQVVHFCQMRELRKMEEEREEEDEMEGDREEEEMKKEENGLSSSL